MEHYAGLDVSVKETSVCVIDGAGRVVCEVKVPTEPDTIRVVLADEAFDIRRIGLEAGPLSQWLYGELAEAGLPMICVETRHMRAALSAQVNKSDRNDARGIAQMMRVGLYRPVHVKTLASPPATNVYQMYPKCSTFIGAGCNPLLQKPLVSHAASGTVGR